jgi:transcription elongation factor GreA
MYDKVTLKDIKRMQEEIEYRKLVVRKEALEDVKAARAHGDLSENFEYKAAKQFKNQNESRIRYLERMIKTAQIIPETSNMDEVGLNDRVTIYYPEDQEEETVKIVTTVRSNSLKGRISIDSPLGKALLNKKVNDRVVVRGNANGREFNFEVIIRKIEKLEDNGEDELRKY